MRYVDPSGHIPKEEICKYLGICTQEEFLEIYGQELFDLLWDTDITWGDKLEWTYNGERQVAMLVLFSTDGTTFQGSLWGIEGGFVGKPIYLEFLTQADKDKNGYSTVHHSMAHPEIKDAKDLPLFFGMPEGPLINTPYMFPTNYYNLPEGTITLFIVSGLVGGTLPKAVAWVGKVIFGVDLAATVVGMFPETPYWFSQTFGEIETYPLVCFCKMDDEHGPIDVSLFRPGFGSYRAK